ncbi:hypothetical protein NRS6148_04346 [Bacillus subtilis]|nr:hypothetical protein NRS6148_04346 [Bacillus subtilis]
MPCGKPRDAARKYPAETSAATDLVRAIDQRTGNPSATGRSNAWPLQPTTPIAIEANISSAGRR